MTDSSPVIAVRSAHGYHSPLVVTGFMGTGKTSVGRIVAQKLGRDFIDMDTVIETRERQSVREIFATRGETYFRAREGELCAELAARDDLVIATGGGALVNPDNRARFAGAFVVCLDATVDAILARLAGAQDRPLLAGGAREQIEALLNARREAYAAIAAHVDTTDQTIEQSADEVIALFKAATND